MSRDFTDLTGKRFGRWTVISFAGQDKNKNKKWFCKCDCGEFKIVLAGNLTSGRSVSCGCFNRELMSFLNKTHGCSNTKLYRKHQSFKHYYKKQIAKDLITFESFNDFAKDRYDEKNTCILKPLRHELYSQENSIFTTRKMKMRNIEKNKFITYNGVTLCKSAWAEKIGVSRQCLYKREQLGWTTERILEKNNV